MNKYLTVPELAHILRCSHPTIYRYISHRQIPYIKQGHRVLFDRSDIEVWMDNKKIPAIGLEYLTV